MMKDLVLVRDFLRLAGNGLLRLAGPVEDEKEVIKVEGFFSCFARERGKYVPGSRREGKNIWTLTGREFSALLMSYSFYGTSAHAAGAANPDVPFRDDRIRYFGFGTGIQPEVSSVSRLVTPIAFDGANNFLAQVGIPTFPLTPSRTTVQYSRTYSELELSVVGSVVLTEAGLFTDGSPTSSYTPRTRDITLANASQQAPAAYKSFEPFKKTQNFALQVDWQIRF